MYLVPMVPTRTRPRARMSGLGIERVLGPRFPVPPIEANNGVVYSDLPAFQYRLPTSYPTPVAPRPQTSPTASPVASVPANQNPGQGMCIVTSSPATGSVTSTVPCANVGPNRGGTVQPVDTALPANPATPVPGNYPTNEPYYASDGSVWTWNSSIDEWQEEQAPGSVFLPSYGSSAISPVPAGYPTTQPYYAANGSVWSYNPTAGQWMQVSSSSSIYGTGYGYPGSSPVPAGYPITQPYYAGDGSVWNYQPTTGTWVETELPGTAAASLVSSGAPGSGGVMVSTAAPAAVTSDYGAVLDWFGQSTIIGGVKNIWIVGGAALLVLFLKNRKGR